MTNRELKFVTDGEVVLGGVYYSYTIVLSSDKNDLSSDTKRYAGLHKNIGAWLNPRDMLTVTILEICDAYFKICVVAQGNKGVIGFIPKQHNYLLYTLYK